MGRGKCFLCKVDKCVSDNYQHIAGAYISYDMNTKMLKFY